MDTIDSLVTDERTARVARAVAIEPAEPTTSKTIAEVGASETLRLISSTGLAPGVDKVAGELWRELATPRLTPKTVQSRRAQERPCPCNPLLDAYGNL